MIERVVKDVRTETYNSLKEVKEKLDYLRKISRKGIHSLSDEKIEEFKLETKKFFNVIFSLFADTYPKKLFRVTNNKQLCNGKKQKLQKVSQLIGPPKNKSFFGRCNLPGESVFYAALDFKTALWETKPEIGDYITVSEWRIKKGERLNTHMIFHPRLSKINYDSKKAFVAWLAAKRQINPEWADIFEELVIFLTEEYMKIVDYTERENYLISGLYSSILIQTPPDENGFKIDAICYPSIKMEYGLTNLAIVNSLVLKKLELVEIKVYDVQETNYDVNNKNTSDLIKVSPMIIKTSDFDLEGDKINYDLKAELRLAIELHEKYGGKENTPANT